MTISVTAVWIDHETTRQNPEHATSTSPDATSGGLGAFLDKVARFVAAPSASVMLDGTIPAQLGLTGPPPSGSGARGTAALKAAADHGWKIREERVWMPATRTERRNGKDFERTIYLGVVPWMTRESFALLAPGDPLLTLWRMYMWSGMLGVPYWGEQVGLNGINIIRDRCVLKNEPRWHLPNVEKIPPAKLATELPYAWKGPQPTSGYVHQFDATAQHLGAMGVVHVSGDMLQRRRAPQQLERANAPGYYQLMPPAWEMARSLPHPIGRLRDGPGSPVWVTHVTLDFLVELHEEYGIVALPEVLDSWVSDSRVRVFREFGSILAKALRHATSYQEDPEIYAAVKALYKATVGLMERPGGRISRPDWAHAVKAQARVNQWRKVYREGARERYRPPRSSDVLIGSGRWPVEIETDAIWYASPTEEPLWPATFLRGDGLTGGTFVVKKSREVSNAR